MLNTSRAIDKESEIQAGFAYYRRKQQATMTTNLIVITTIETIPILIKTTEMVIVTVMRAVMVLVIVNNGDVDRNSDNSN